MQTTTITFNTPLRPSNLEQFRQLVAEYGKSDLFHNHQTNDSTIYRYPLVQYRVHGGKATLFAINEGCDAVGQLLKNEDLVAQLGGIDKETNDHNFDLKITENTFAYRIYHYIPFKPDSYNAYKQLPNMVAKIQMLEQLLQNHILSLMLCDGQQQIDKSAIKISILDLDRVEKVSAFGTSLMAFDMVFNCNIALPNRIALGRKLALGYGWLYKM